MSSRLDPTSEGANYFTFLNYYTMPSISYYRSFKPTEIYRLGNSVGSGELKKKIEKNLGSVFSIDMEEAPHNVTEIIIKFRKYIDISRKFFNQEMDSILDSVGIFDNQPQYA